MTKKYYELFAIMCLCGKDWRRVGILYRTKETAQSWRSFCKSAVYARRSRVDRIRIELDDKGRPTEAAKQMMSEKYNMDVT